MRGHTPSIDLLERLAKDRAASLKHTLRGEHRVARGAARLPEAVR